ncbi:hypothetical protein A9P82_08525 [Arachidicoccus ginsenosidimutans]|uniref:hypothetical protein n=1 Tax=Arachidicoccus sp. BS20 TaxID=1850526 RepID=UPI0007F0C1A2|nr:hypothetical protein [Arachidicoccus sp. BS20]ANI89332.1 hypothetical protein A9P82_08525 [Arachidicoccus sp. BS20]
MLLGYTIDLSENDFYMYGDDIILDDCARYGDIYSINKVSETLKIKSKKNIFYIRDGFTIVSEQFKLFCEKENYAGLEFVSLPNSKGFYWFKINNIIEYDTERKKTRFINYNEDCKGYEEIIGRKIWNIV